MRMGLVSMQRVSHVSRSVFLLIMALLIGTLMSGQAISSDDDEKPPYMIYVDPVTGKYTTEDPYRENAVDLAQDTKPDTKDGNSVSFEAIVISLLLLATIALVLKRRHAGGGRV